MQALGTTVTARYWLSPGGPADASRRYRSALTAQGVDLAESLGSDGSWAARWRSGDGRCFEVRAQPVLGADALRLAERGVECGRPSNP